MHFNRTDILEAYWVFGRDPKNIPGSKEAGYVDRAEATGFRAQINLWNATSDGNGHLVLSNNGAEIYDRLLLKSGRKSGFITKKIASDLHAKIHNSYLKELESMIGPRGFKKKQVADMMAGFDDGVRAMFQALCDMDVVKAED